MNTTTIRTGVILFIIGILGYLGSGMIDGHYAPTALIPAGIGSILIVLGFLAGNPKLRMHVMHAAVLIALIGCVMSVWRLLKTIHEGELNGVKLFSLGGTAIIAGLFTVLCVRSFIAARKARTATTAV